LPTATSSFTLYIVRPGESLCQIAIENYGECVRWVRIWEANDKFPKPHLIHPGQELVIP
jgi:nucleoid-associated protein YgaU